MTTKPTKGRRRIGPVVAAPTITTPAPTTPGWRTRAACRDSDPELFFPDPGQSSAVRTARSICAHCPVIDACRAFIEDIETQRGARAPHGIWAGTTAEERRLARGGKPRRKDAA